MKKVLILSAFMFGVSTSFAQIAPPDNPHKVQVAILFDTSNSMDGLIDQAKARIWNIVNEISSLTYDGYQPALEFALYHYGNDNLSKSSNYIEQLLPLSGDLDAMSQKLFGLTTNGGSEYCGAVIGQSLSELAWSENPTDLKMIYIAGNEPFDQGPVPFKRECEKAQKMGVYVNTIYCGNYDKGVQEKWFEGADCSGGDYFNIDSNREIVHIDTPYDLEIRKYNDSINSTYYGYGIRGREKKAMQTFEDSNAEMESAAVATDRAVVKSKKGVYKNAEWDLVDAAEEGVDITEIEEEQLPDEFKDKTDEEKLKLIEEKSADRDRFQSKISELSKKRQDFIDAEMKKRAETEEVDDFGSSVNKSILEKAESIGFKKEAHD